MEQTFLEKLKRVKWSDLLHIFKFLLAFPISLVVRKKHPHLWLLCDTRYEARDNAYWLFRYIRSREPEQDVMFAIDVHSPDMERIRNLGRVVAYGSLQHWIYYLAAEKNVSSQKMGKPNAAICYVLEVYGILKNKRAFLQHGIITADLSFLYYEHTRMALFVTSTKAEWEYVNAQYHYPPGIVQELGLCRFDALHDGTVNKKQILLMPTWRMYIRNELTDPNPEKQKKQFVATDYYKYWEEVLSHPALMQFLQDKDCHVVFYPHREMSRFLSCFHVKSERIRIAKWPEDDVQQLLKESACLVTDFSSVAMDFAYMKKPLLYYQFDNEKFREKHHGAGYFDFQTDGFGPVVTKPDEVIGWLKECENDGFENRQVYLKREEAYFDLWDADNCKRNYEAILAM